MRIVVTGATGLLGRALVNRLVSAGDSVAVLTRDASKARRVLPLAVDIFEWDPYTSPPPPDALRDAGALVHLAGEPVIGLWTSGKKKKISQSRILTTQSLVAALEETNNSQIRVVSASAVGFYGDRGSELLTEQAQSGQGFVPDLVRAWEDSLTPLAEAGIRSIALRFGLVLSRHGGAFKQLLLPWKFGLGVKMGDGSQWWPWIHIEDAVGLMDHALRGHISSRVVNCVAPAAVTQKVFAAELARMISRPRLLRLPRWILSMLLGGMSWELLASRKVVPSETSYTFQFPSLQSALKDLALSSESTHRGKRRYQAKMWINAPIDEVFRFFSDPGNLERITPPWLKFQTRTLLPIQLGVGTIIDYRLRIRWVPVHWQSEITEWDPPWHFVDVQRRGPYRSWVHTHKFEMSGSGTLISDIVDYKVTGGYLVDALLVRRDLERIFSYRQASIRRLLCWDAQNSN